MWTFIFSAMQTKLGGCAIVAHPVFIVPAANGRRFASRPPG
jgi:hypothetical protein